MDLTKQLNDFFALHNKQPVEVEDPSALDQCMDLAFAWCDFINIPRSTIRHQWAYQVFTQPNADTTKYFDIVKNSLFNSPVNGDLVVFGTKVGVAGHICIFRDGGLLTFNSFDQNWNGHHYAEMVNHPYDLSSNGTLGWLHPKLFDTPTDPCADLKKQIVDLQAKIDSAKKVLS